MRRRKPAKAMTLSVAEREKTVAGFAGDAAGASAPERILQEAERVFARFGYDGASLRQIAEAAAVPVALVSYHFGSKDGLYRAVFNRRAPTVVEQRLAGLAIAMSEADLDRRLELIVKALVMPMLRLRARDNDPSFGRLVAQESTDANSEVRGIIRDLFDPIAYEILAMLRSALADRSERDIQWAYQFMLGAMVFVMADTGRIARLSEGLCRPDDEDAAVAHMVAFLTAGMRFGTPVASPASLRNESRRKSGGKTTKRTKASPR
ncbi:MAG: TetR/AcrR family transcriptional regulator [Xanthobacteraceae bacterium]